MPQTTRPKFDWPAIRAAYVETIQDDGTVLTLDQVARQFDVAPRSVKARASTEGWVRQREQFRARLSEEQQRRRIERLADTLSQFDDSAIEIARAGMAEVQRNLDAATEEPTNPTRLERLANAARRFQEVGRLALGASTDRRDGRSELSGPDGGRLQITLAELVAQADEAQNDGE